MHCRFCMMLFCIVVKISLNINDRSSFVSDSVCYESKEKWKIAKSAVRMHCRFCMMLFCIVVKISLNINDRSSFVS